MRKYRDKFRKLVEEAKDRDLRVKIVKDIYTHDFVGMNPEAAKVLDFKCPSNTIVIDSNLDWREKCHTLKHEIVEYDLMKRGMSYGRAHRRALKLEREV